MRNEITKIYGYYRSYYTNVKLSSEYLEKKSSILKSKGITSIAIKEYANKLYSDLRYGSEFERW